MIWFLLAGCATRDDEIARLEARLAELEARVAEVEARPALDVDALMKQADELMRAIEPAIPSEETAPVGVPLAIFDDVDALASMGRALVHIGPEGTADGFRLSAIRAGSLPARAGLKNGDIVHAVNGRPLASLEGALAAWDAVKNEDPTELKLSLTRRGEPMELTIPVLPPGTPVDLEGSAEPEAEVRTEGLSEAEKQARRAELQQRLAERRAQREAEAAR